MANRRCEIMAEPVGPSFLPGMDLYADTVTLTKTKTLTLTFPAKTIVAVLAASTADTDAEKIVWASSVSGNVGTVTFTATSAGSTNKFSYIVIASQTETIAANTLTDDTTQTPVQ
jgi:hypothetical protein